VKSIYITEIVKNNPGKDIYKVIAAQMFEVSEEEVTNEIRKRAKLIAYPEIYRSGELPL